MAQDPPDLRKDFNEAARRKPPAGPTPPTKDPGKPQLGKDADMGIDSIKRHKPENTFEMKGLGGPGVRQEAAKAANAKDWQKYNGNRAEKYANIEKKGIVDKGDVRNQNNKRLTPIFNKATEKPI